LLAKDPTWRGAVPAYNQALREWTNSHGVPLVDLEREFEDLPSELFLDECHFVPSGYQKLAEIVAGRLELASGGIVRVTPRLVPRVAAPDVPATRR
jgi:lysophospholipase L1-like esterase